MEQYWLWGLRTLFSYVNLSFSRNSHQVELTAAVARSLLSRWSNLVQQLEAALQLAFYPDTIEEWLEENVLPSMQRLQDLLQDLGEAAAPLPLPPPPSSCWDTGQNP